MTNLDLNNNVESNMSEFTKSGSNLTGGTKIKRGGSLLGDVSVPAGFLFLNEFLKRKKTNSKKAKFSKKRKANSKKVKFSKKKVTRKVNKKK
tara:strand:- start:67 stop:342 length:276 start_codon:yes stop_codon:yes gene_type:complete